MDHYHQINRKQEMLSAFREVFGGNRKMNVDASVERNKMPRK